MFCLKCREYAGTRNFRFDDVFDTKNASQYAISYLLQQFSNPILSLGRPLRRTHTRRSVHSFPGRAGRHQPTLFSFEISRRREGGRAAAQRIVVFFFNTQSPFSSPFPPLYISGPTNNGRQGFNKPHKEDTPPRIDQKRTYVLNICQRRKKRTCYVRAQGLWQRRELLLLHRSRNIKATCSVRWDGIALAMLTGGWRLPLVRCSIANAFGVC